METDKLSLLRNALSAYQLRSQALAANIANLDTPGYQRLNVSFEETLQEVRTTVGGLREASEVLPSMEVGDGPPILEDEMMELADTQMRQQLSTRALTEHFSLMRTGITGRSL